MPHTLSETGVYDDTDLITVPDPGDARTAASVNGPFQQLANHTRYLKNQITQILSYFAGTLNLAIVSASSLYATVLSAGSASVTGNISSSTGNISTSSGNLSASAGTVSGRALAGGYTLVNDRAGATLKIGPSIDADSGFSGSFYFITNQSLGVAFRLQTTGVVAGSIVLLKLLTGSPNPVTIQDAGGITLYTLAAGKAAILIYDGTAWQQIANGLA